MKTLHSITAIALLWLTTIAGWSALTIPGANGSDGALNITVSTNIDLGLAVTGPWDTNNTAHAGNGVYDPDKWAVVFKYTSVNIANGATVTFKNHPSRAPVVWLVSTNVTIDGTLSLEGSNANFGNPPEGGPGGFRGGGRSAYGPYVTSGFGPGGGYGPLNNQNHAVFGQNLPGGYGSAELVPLVGGSGGGGYNSGATGTGGGGAILIAAAQIISLSGSIRANGGQAAFGGESTYGRGSGGAIRLVTHEVSGSGRIEALGSDGFNLGRTRLQATVASPTLSVMPAATLESPTPVVLWPDTNVATVRVVSVSGQATPADPRAALENSPADLNLATTNSVSVLLETTNFPTNGVVNVFIKPRNTSQTTYQAGLIGGSTASATWQVQHALLPGFSVIQARAVAP